MFIWCLFFYSITFLYLESFFFWINISIWATAQLPNYPSPNLTLTLTVVGFGEGKVGSCSGTDIDPYF